MKDAEEEPLKRGCLLEAFPWQAAYSDTLWSGRRVLGDLMRVGALDVGYGLGNASSREHMMQQPASRTRARPL